MVHAQRVLLAISGLLFSLGLQAATIKTEIEGVSGDLLSNVRASLSLVRAEGLDDPSVLRLRQMTDKAVEEVERALQPFGYYQPSVHARLDEPQQEGAPWQARVQIQPGEPVRIAAVELNLLGACAEDPAFDQWRDDWPLGTGRQLDHRVWETALDGLERLAEERGYFLARFAERRIIVDPEHNSARILVRFESGPRYHFGEHESGEHPFSERLMRRLRVIEPGEPYSLQALDAQREVLTGAGLFQRVAIDPEHEDGQEQVNLQYRLETRPPNTWRSSLGFGTDTGARAQFGWTRHYLSSRGNSLDIGLGVQQRRSEYVLQADYLHPRGNDPHEFLTAGTRLRSEQDHFRFNDEDRFEPVFDAFRGRRDQAELSLGRLQSRSLGNTRFKTLEERLFVSLLHESFDAFREASFSDENLALLNAYPELVPFLKTTNRVVALGAEWHLPWVEGTGFDTRGLVLAAHLIGAHESLGSDVSFAQAWTGGRLHWRLGERHKLLIGGEAGYTQANTHRLSIALDGRELELNLTELPERYRFKTGGDRTVRGYAFEDLSTNRNGANHLLQASVEYELRVGQNWSVAVFGDIGNAFNDPKRRKLKRGLGAGFRWYTMIGPIQLDFARALDQFDRPWRLHFTIGTRLL